MSEPPAQRIRVFLIDALGLFRASLSRYLSSEGGLEVAGECGTASEALEILSSLSDGSVDVILLDFDLGTEHACDFIPSARAAGYQGRFLIVSGTAEARDSALALKLGASGIFLKSEPPDRLVQVIRFVATGDVWIDRRVVDLLAREVIERVPASAAQISGEQLGEREQKVLLGILGGLSNRKIGTTMGISESSVKNVIQNLFTRTGVRKRSQLVRIALEGSLGSIAASPLPTHHEPVTPKSSKLRHSEPATGILEPEQSSG
jgi:DNA-binding NarL/FixJ family response regulator